jgi:hypothetical protein
MFSEWMCVGKGIKGFVARPGQQSQARAVSPSKRKQRALVKVVVGNKKMMAQEAIVVSQAVDDYMREMEVSQPALLESHVSMLSVKIVAFWLPTCHQGGLSLCTRKKRKEKTTPFGVNSMRSQVLYRAAQDCAQQTLKCAEQTSAGLCIVSE